MIYVELPHECDRRLSFFLSMEEYVARALPMSDEEGAFFMWQTGPSVIFGRNQLVENEVNLSYCREHNIAIYRRKSGGGCVYSDMGNVMLSFITAEKSVALAFNRYLNLICLALMKVGVEATISGRNDILIGGRKVSGNAFFNCAGRSIVHGTMLYDTNMANMLAAITPGRVKLESNGVESVRSRIALLKDHVSMGLPDIMATLRQTLCCSTVVLNKEQVMEIERIESEYLEDSFIYGHNPRATKTIKKHIDGVGNVEVRLDVKGGKIRDINILGDYFLVGDLEADILSSLRGACFTHEGIEKALEGKRCDVIKGLDKRGLMAILTE